MNQRQQQGSTATAIARRIFFLLILLYCIAFFVDNVMLPGGGRYTAEIAKLKEAARSTLANVAEATSAKVWK